MSALATFGKKEHLCGVAEVEKLFSQGRSFTIIPYRVVWLTVPDPGPVKVKMLITVPKKKFRLAVVRNLLKRRTKEAFRLNRQVLDTRSLKEGCQLWIGLSYIGGEASGFREIQEKIIVILQRLSRELTFLSQPDP